MDIDQEKLARNSTGQLGLLVSVRDRQEALVVDQAGVDVLDVKEPRNGPLGKSEDKEISAILSAVGSSTIVSIALGDIDDCEMYLKSNSIPKGVRLAKCGLAQSIHSDWRDRVSKVWESIRESCDPVAVAYSDFEQCDSPQPMDIVELAGQQGVKFLLLDTYLKNGTSSLDLLNEDDLTSLVERAKQFRMVTVLAGSLRYQHLSAATRTGFDLIGVRGAVCSGERTEGVDSSLLNELKNRVRFCNRDQQMEVKS